MLYDNLPQKRDRQAQLVEELRGGVFRHCHSSEGEQHRRHHLRVCVLQAPADVRGQPRVHHLHLQLHHLHQEEGDAAETVARKQMTSPMKCEGLFCIYDIFTSAV